MMVELIPKREQKPIFGETFFLIVALAIFLSVGVAFFMFQGFSGKAREELAALDKTLVEDTRPLEEKLSASMQAYRKKTEMLKTVLERRKNPLAFFALLEQTTHPDIFFQKLQTDTKTGTFTLEGGARSFFVLEQQRLFWKNHTAFENALSDIRLGEEGRVSFRVVFMVKPAVFEPL